MKLRISHSVAAFVIYIVFFVSGSIAVGTEPKSKLLFDFSNESAAEQWLSVNDNVMGGISEGRFRITDDKTLEFSGNLSLENRGGFASIRTRPANLNLTGYETIALHIRGDGRTYYFNTSTSFRSAAASYRAPIETQKGAWNEVRINLKDLVYTAFGRVIPEAPPLKASDIQSMGFTLADKKPGPFRLEIDWIKAEKSASDSAESRDIVDTAAAAGTFKTLIAAAKAAGLVDALKDKGPLTVFAPNDEAFAKLPEGTLEALLLPENRDRLIAILSYHVVPGKILLGEQSRVTLLGQPVSIRTTGAFQVNGAEIIASDVIASNGVIHIIDSVLTPEPAELSPQESARAVIELAIKRGVPLFNAGQPSACAAIYEVAVESLLKSHTKALSDKNRSILQNALREIRQPDQDSRQQAWTLRRALDAVYESLTQ